MKKLLLFSMGVLMFMASHVYAQTRTITGTVTEKDDGGPLPGVSVMIKGAKTGTQSNAQGKFSINASTGQTLVFSSVGYIAQSVVISGSTVSVVMIPTQTQLSDVMVVGYGTQNRRDNVGSIAQIKGSDLVEQPVQNFEQALAGKAAGVQITIPNGVLNTPPVFHIRGTSSINLSSQPLIVIDGVVSFTGDFSGGESGGNAISNVNPDDIESIVILKDASATAIYGSRGANGVVLITTKKGKKGDAVVSMDSWIGVTTVNRLPKVLNASQYITEKNEAIANAGSAAQVGFATDANGNNVDQNWRNLVYQRGVAYNSTVSVSGGTDKTSYYASANWSKQGGILRTNEFNNKSVLFNIDHKANKYISFGLKLSYQNNLNLAATTSGSLNGEAYNTSGLGRLALLLPPNLPAYNNDGTYNLNPATGALGTGPDKNVSISYTNPAVALALDRSNNEINHIASNIYLQVKPLPWITLKTVYGIDYLFSNNDAFFDPIDNFSIVAGVTTNSASATDSYLANKRYVWDNTAQFDKSFGKHTVSLLLGNEQQSTNQTGFGINRSILNDPSFNVIQAGYVNVASSGQVLTQNYLVSFFGRVNYNFDEKYLLQATLRKDGYSAFGSNKKYGFFPSIGAGWEITKEDFWKSIGADKIFSSFKLRGGYGRVGNNGIGDFASYGTYSASGLFNANPTLVANATGNNQLAWETSSKTDFGLDFGILNDRITGQISYYKDNTTGLILPFPEPPSAGLPGAAPLVNIGSLFNRGLEINIDADIIRKGDFRWNANFNISFNQNQITSLLPGQTFLPPFSTSGLETTSIDRVGGSIGDLYIIKSAGVDPNNGDRIFLNAAGHKVEYNFVGTNIPGLGLARYFNLDGTPYLNAAGGLNTINQTADAGDYANAIPKEVGGLSNTFRYKNFDLNVLMTYQLGFYVYYGTQATLTDQRFWNNSTIILDHWTAAGQTARYPRVVFGDNVSNGTSFPTDFNTYRGDFLKFKTINLGYTLPKPILNKLGVRSVRVYVTGQNLFIVTKYPGPDPEVGSNGTSNSTPGIDRNTAGNGRTVTAGISLKF
jgi:TonB-linked SusC/RagA family outer membrane protein